MATGRRGVFSSFLVLQEELDRIIHDVVAGRPRGAHARSWSPPADVFICKDTVVVRFEVAGVRRDEIDLTYHDGQLTVRGTRLENADEPKQGYWQMEIWHGPFERSVNIPVEVDPDRIEAVCREGLLEVRMPILAREDAVKEARIVTDA